MPGSRSRSSAPSAISPAGSPRDPRLAGAWTGNTVDAKPENYASRAVPLELFARVVAEGIAEHNARPGRRSRICGGRLSFQDVFRTSYETAPIRKATAEQRRLWLLAAEGVTVRTDATLHLLGNRYWCDALVGLQGTKIVARFDPEALQNGLHVYRLDGSYVAHAPCIEATGFADQEAARAHAKARQDWLRAQKQALEAERRLSIQDVAAMLPVVVVPEPAPDARVVRPLFGVAASALALNPQPEIDPDETLRLFQAGVARLVANKEGA